MKPPHGYQEIMSLFGNPANADGTVNAVWEARNIISVAPSAGWQLYYQTDEGPVKVRSIRMHKLLKEEFLKVLQEIWEYARTQLGNAATDQEIRDWLHDLRVDIHGGGYNFRKKRSGRKLSLHSFGIAIDWDPLNNPMGADEYTLPDWWYDIWTSNGWTDGRSFSDPMHVQFATGA